MGRRGKNMDLYENCHLCARNCGINRHKAIGYCRETSEIYLSRAALHMWEEPPISGTKGSGTIFFSGCSLSCVFCQNSDISRGRSGKPVSTERLAEIMLELEANGAHNINLVTPTHYIPSLAVAIPMARKMGLTIPIVYNTGSYDNVDALRTLDGLVDIYLPDLKYYNIRTAESYSHAGDYPIVARDAIAEMYRQVGSPIFDDEGIMRRGMIVRILLLPGRVAEAKLSLKYLIDTYGDNIYVSLMNQYTPMPGMVPPLNRKVTREEYNELLDYAEKLGLKNGFTQDFGTASESFIPPFNCEGV